MKEKPTFSSFYNINRCCLKQQFVSNQGTEMQVLDNTYHSHAGVILYKTLGMCNFVRCLVFLFWMLLGVFGAQHLQKQV